VAKYAKGKVLDVGKSKYWEYGFPTIDINPKMKPTYIGDIEKTDFTDGGFDMVLRNGMYELIDNPQKMINEVLRITKRLAIFGFVGRDYKPYRRNWKFYEGKEVFPPHIKKDFGREYHFVICQK